MRIINFLLACTLSLALAASVLAKPATNVDELQKIVKAEKQRHELLRGFLFQQMKRTVPFRGMTPDGRNFELVGVKPDGRPLYLATENLNAAKTISTFPLLPGGLAGLDLDGSGTTANMLAIWDGGSVLATHSEFEGRVTLVDTTDVADHATHVAGTMISAGHDFDSRGMSPAAELSSYEWDYDTDEMAAAAIKGLRISNHSYGYLRGWDYGNYSSNEGWHWFGDVNVSTTEDYGFGFYSDETKAWDEIAYNAPYYLICKSAGNDRGDKPPLGVETTYFYAADGSGWTSVSGDGGRERDGGTDGFDCLGDVSCAKNIMTVGAVKDITTGYTSTNDLRLTTLESYTAFGPTDDGRVKPDVVGNGEQLYSTFSDNNYSYGVFSGTSMACPNVSGSINLLLRYFESTHHDSMLACTAKALVLHTADDDGILRGPDYRFGWGLMNTTTAVDLIAQDTTDTMAISEHVLMDGEAQAWAFSCDGTQPLKITISWTDPPGVASRRPSLNSRASKLINDLDLWVAGPNDELYYPWTLDPDNPSHAAVRDKPNHVDNTEQVVVDTPAVGQYTAYIMHSGTLTDGQQAYGMIVTGTTGDLHATTARERQAVALPSQFAILGSFPNPFNPSATVRIALPESGRLTVKVYNVLGRKVATLADGVQSGGVHSFLFNAERLPSGIYIVRAEAEKLGVRTHKMLLVR